MESINLEKLSTSLAFLFSTLELITIFERTREILWSTEIENSIVALLRSCPTYELRDDPVIWATYSRGWLDWSADVTLVQPAPNPTSLNTDTILQPINGSECITNGNQTPLLPERNSEELEALMQRGINIIESQGGVVNAMTRVAIIVHQYPLDKIRSDPILWAVYTRAWEDRADLED
ncbi:hypothetical protein QTP88_008452 [Uroleucon formosanum]